MISKSCAKDSIAKHTYMHYSKSSILFDRFWLSSREVTIKRYSFGNYFNCEYICSLFLENKKKCWLLMKKKNLHCLHPHIKDTPVTSDVSLAPSCHGVPGIRSRG